MTEIETKLKAPFPQNAIHWRVGSTNIDKTQGIALAYIDARDVMNRLDEVVGMDNWEDDYKEVKGRLVCNLKIRLNGEWVTKSDGAGDTDIEGDKGGLSDAFKRAAVKFGIGRYLYALPNKWMPLKPQGRSYALAQTPELPAWALPEGTKSTTGNNATDEPPKLDGPPMTEKQRGMLEGFLDSTWLGIDEQDVLRNWLKEPHTVATASKAIAKYLELKDERTKDLQVA